MANAQPAPPSNLRPMRPIQRVPFVEENLPLTGPPLTDPNDQASAAASSARAAASPSVAAPSAMSALGAAAPILGAVAPALGGVAPVVSRIASAVPSVEALISSPSAAGVLNVVAPALGGAVPALSGIASAVPAGEAFLSAPSAATALGAAAPALSAVAPGAAQYANPLLQTIASHDLNPPFGDMADRAAGIGQSHPQEDAAVRNFLNNNVPEQALKLAMNTLVIRPALVAVGAAATVAGVAGGAIAGVFLPSTPLNVGESEQLRQLRESAPPSGSPPSGPPPGD